MPWTVSRSISASRPWPASSPCRSATDGASTRSPSTPSSGSSLTRPGRSSSIGKASTSVGPSLSIHCPLSSAMVSSSTALMHSSACGWTRIWSITKRASRDSRRTSSSWPDSLRTSMLIGWPCPPSSGAVRGRWACGSRLRVEDLVGLDDATDEAVAYDVGAGEAAEGDVLDAVEDALDHAQPGLGARRQVDLAGVAGDDDPRAEAEAGQEHLHLLGRRVLRLVEDDEGVVERATAQERQRRDLDGAGGQQLGDGLGVDHVVQRVVERAQVGVDLLAERAGQEAEPLPRLDGRAAQDDPVDLLGLQRLHGLRHREVGLAGAGGADAEGDRAGVDRLDVALLVERLRADRAAAVGQDVEAQHVGRALLRLGAQHLDDPLDGLAGHALPGAHEGDDLVEQSLGLRDLGGVAGERDPVAADVDGGLEGPLDQPEVLVARTQDRDHVDAVGDHDGVRRLVLLADGASAAGVVLRVVSVMDARDGRPSGSVAEPLHATERAAYGPPSCPRARPRAPHRRDGSPLAKTPATRSRSPEGVIRRIVEKDRLDES